MSTNPVDDLAALVSLQKHLQSNLCLARHRLDRSRLVYELRQRLVRNQQTLQATLLENIRTAKRAEFHLTFDAFKDAVLLYNANRKAYPHPQQSGTAIASHDWLQTLPNPHRAVLSSFLQNVVSNNDFLCRRLLALPHHALSVLSGSPGGASLRDASPSTSAAIPAPVAQARPLALKVNTGQATAARKALDACRHDPFSLLFELVGKHATDTHQTQEASRNAWASICAAMLKAKKPGSDKLVIALFDAHTFDVQHDGNGAFESWLIETLQTGRTFSDDIEKQWFRIRTDDDAQYSQHDTHAYYAFIDSAVLKLFALLANQQSHDLVPTNAIALGLEVARRLHDVPERAQAAAMFLATRWFFASYLMDRIVYPEAHGLLTGVYVTEDTRHRILREIGLKAQGIALDYAYAWKHGPGVQLDARLTPVLDSIVLLFTPRSNLTRGNVESNNDARRHEIMRCVCPSDVLTLIDALYPPCENPNATSHQSHSARGMVELPDDLAQARSELIRFLQTNDTSGVCLPTEDSWHRLVAIIDRPIRYSDSDSDHVRTDSDHSPDTSSSEGDGPAALNGDPEYLQLRDVAFSLLAAHSLNVRTVYEADKLTYKRLPGEHLSKMLHRMLTKIAGRANKNPFRLKSQRSLDWSRGFKEAHSTADGDPLLAQVPGIISDFLVANVTHYEQRDRFAQAIKYSQLLSRLDKSDLSEPRTQIALVLCWAHELERNIRVLRVTSRKCNNQLDTLERQLAAQDRVLTLMMKNVEDLRIRMWYHTEVRHTASFEELLKVSATIYVMADGRSSRSRGRTGSAKTDRSDHRDPQRMALTALFQLMTTERYGLSDKLSDDQVSLTAEWMQRMGIENLSRGEERLHRFLCEIAKCVQALGGPDTTKNPELWASPLFQRERSEGFQQAMSFELTQTPNRHESVLSLLSNARSENLSTISLQLVVAPENPRDMPYQDFGADKPRAGKDAPYSSVTTLTSATFWSTGDASSATSLKSDNLSPYTVRQHSVSTESFGAAANVRNLLTNLERGLVDLVLSELCPTVFASGSETDLAMWTGPGAGFAGSLHARHNAQGLDKAVLIRKVLARFEHHPSPFVKLKCIADLQTLLLASWTEPYSPDMRTDSTKPRESGSGNNDPTRAPVMQSQDELAGQRKNEAVKRFRDVFGHAQLRPKGLFLSLQTIASMVPREVLDSQPSGEAFWNAAIAALSLKQEVCAMMLEAADSVIRGPEQTSSKRGHSGHEAIDDLADAARLLLITAKEGNAAAQRELATLYLTSPESVELAAMPMSRIDSTVGRVDVRSSTAGSTTPDVAALAIRLAHHWMDLSHRGGDALAAKYLERTRQPRPAW